MENRSINRKSASECGPNKWKSGVGKGGETLEIPISVTYNL